jgi:PAS domain S-box-containing protein
VVPEPSTSLPPARPGDPFGVLVEAAPDGVLTVDVRGAVLTCNAAAERMFGCARADVLGRDVRLLVPEPPVGDVGRRRTIEGRRQDGTAFPIEVTIAEIEVAGERQLGMFIRDLGAVGRLEAHWRQSQKMEALGRLAFGLARDVNDLVTVILGHSDTVLAALPQQHASRSDVAEIRKAGDQAAALTRRLLAFSRRQPLAPRPLDLNDVVLDLEGMLQRLLGDDVTMGHALAPESPVVMADLAQLEQVIVTLALNARDAMPAGGQLTFATRVVTAGDRRSDADRTPSGRFVVLTLTDAGVDIPPDVVGDVFRTEFRICLPAADVPSTKAPRGATAVQAAGRTPTILVVEDDAFLRGVTALFLQTAGYVVRVAGLGVHALERADESGGPIDLLVTDLALPDMTGRELADRLCARHAALRVLFISGYPETLEGSDLENTGHPYLQKPFTPAALGEAVRAILDGAHGGREARRE